MKCAIHLDLAPWSTKSREDHDSNRPNFSCDLPLFHGPLEQLPNRSPQGKTHLPERLDKGDGTPSEVLLLPVYSIFRTRDGRRLRKEEGCRVPIRFIERIADVKGFKLLSKLSKLALRLVGVVYIAQES